MANFLKRFGALIAFVVFILTVPVLAKAQTGDEVLDSYLSDLQAARVNSRSEKALQESIIQLVQGMETPPEISSEARRFMIRGETAIEMIAGKEGFVRAADEFRQAARSAPWWPDAYFSLAVAEEKAGNLRGAIAAYKMYQRAAPDAPNVMDVEAKVFKLEYQMEIATTRPKPQTSTAYAPPPEMTGRELMLFIRPSSTPEPTNMKSIASNFRYSVKYRLTGKIVVEFDINDRGRTTNFRVVKANRQGVYDGFAEKLVKKFKFPVGDPQTGVLYDLGFCLKSDKISPILCNIDFEILSVGTGGEPFLLSYSYPYYNQNAANKGVCGNVVTRFDVNNNGVVQNETIVSAEPAGQFGLNIKDALRNFKFETGRAARGLEYKISFSLPGRC